MKSMMIATILFGSTLALAATLEATRWTVQTHDKNQPAKKEADTLVFDKGRFHSTGCDPYGFPAAKYISTSDGFEADTESAKEGKIHWKGTVQGDHIQGSYVWTKAGQAPIEYVFDGKRQ
jgi:hypothetical protein